MILANDFLRMVHDDPDMPAPLRQRLDIGIRSAIRFRLSDAARDAMTECARRPGALDASRGHLFTPATTTWIEWEEATAAMSGRVGWLLLGERDSITDGWAFLVVAPFGDFRDRPLLFGCPFDLRPGLRPILAFDSEQFVSNADGTEMVAIDPGAFRVTVNGTFAPCLLAALALISSPRVATFDPCGDLRKLNKAREARGKVPLLSYRTVSINLDAPHVRQSHQAGETGMMPLHFVRTHLRLTHGRIVLVRPHWRGNPEHGILEKSYRVVRDDDVR